MYIRLLCHYFFSNMILFYSEFCQHCTVLLDTIKRHDKNNMIKTVSIDLLRSLNKPIDPAIHSVPALMLLNTKEKEYIFGKHVFDYLLLPNRGVLFSNQVSSREKGSKDIPMQDSSISQIKTPDEPQAFTLGAISAEQFSSIDDINNAIEDKNYNWGTISEDNSSIIDAPDFQNDVNKPFDGGNQKNLPTMEEIMKQRASDIV